MGSVRVVGQAQGVHPVGRVLLCGGGDGGVPDYGGVPGDLEQGVGDAPGEEQGGAAPLAPSHLELTHQPASVEIHPEAVRGFLLGNKAVCG